jgi:hypothetical protein
VILCASSAAFKFQEKSESFAAEKRVPDFQTVPRNLWNCAIFTERGLPRGGSNIGLGKTHQEDFEYGE